MKTKPFPFQVKCCQKIEQFNGRALVAMEMGLGKSLTSLMFAANNPDLRPLLIICPASLKWNWKQECETHFGWRKVVVLSGSKPPPERSWKKHPIVIVNYDILGEVRTDPKSRSHNRPGWLAYLKYLAPQIVIIDEAHYLANRTAKRTKWCREICQEVPHVLALSGTPIVNRPAELWPVLNLLRPDLYPNFFPFGHKFCGARKTFWGWEFKGASNLEALHSDLKRTVMIRKTKAQVLKELPDKIVSVVPLEIEDYSQYQEALEDFRTWLSKYKPEKKSQSLKAEAVTQLGYLKRLAAELKLPQVIKWVDNFLSNSNGKLLLFGIHKKIISALHQKYRRLSVVLDGSTPMKDRKAIVQSFQTDPRKRVFIGNIKAAGVGLNLTAASTVAFAELDWVPGNHTQASDRAHRIGTKSCVNVHFLVAKDTIEVNLARIIQSKQRTIHRAIDGKASRDLDVFNLLLKELKRRGK